MRIVDHPHQWVHSCCARDEPKHRHADEEAIWRRTTRTAEHRFERILMKRIEVYEVVGDRFAESLQSGVREFHLRLDAENSTDAEILRLVREVIE